MALIDYVDFEELPPEIRARQQREREELGRTALLELVVANNPEIANARAEYFHAVRDAANVDRKIKEICHVVLSQVNECEYCTSSHRQRLVEVVGFPKDRLDDIAAGNYGVLEPDARAAAEFAEQVTKDPKRVSEAQLEALRATGFDDADIIELLVWIARSNASNTIVDALNIHPADRDDYLVEYRPEF